MLVDYAWPQLQRKRLYFQHDGAAPHYAVVVREWLDEKGPRAIRPEICHPADIAF